MEEKLIPQQLSPDLSQDDLIEYFRSKKPVGLTDEKLEDMSCLGFAKLIVGDLGGSEKARIYWMEEPEEEWGNVVPGHAWVVRVDSLDGDKPYNNYLGVDRMKTDDATVGQLREEGLDITEEVLNDPWEAL